MLNVTVNQPADFSLQCGKNDLAILQRPLHTADYKMLIASFSKLRSSKYAWPFHQGPVSMSRIIQKVNLNSYKTFKDFMDEMIDMFQRFRDHFDQNGSHSSKEVQFLVLFLFSNLSFSINVAKLSNTTFLMQFANS